MSNRPRVTEELLEHINVPFGGQQWPVIILSISMEHSCPQPECLINWILDMDNARLKDMIRRVENDEGEAVPQSAVTSKQLETIKDGISEYLYADFKKTVEELAGG